MNEVDMKCVMVIDSELPVGIVANTSAVLGITLGKLVPELVGHDVTDASSQAHLGIIKIPVTMLRGDKEILKNLRERLYGVDFSDLIVADFSDVAQSCKTYDEYIVKEAVAFEQDHTYLGIAICGSKKKVNKLTGSMSLLK
ncbi:DUF2000 domain-containing protein [Lacrimispora amygdalina]|uniref:DUF2000 domain-containing protein n=1 Tax=Lacrimispora amygdalina TaxID=253257 RepID=A0A3E2N3R0_9FIRM|nr:DUF2000 domain-containing protein [Clostridium indicum]RFZ75608.1 DUF2000 domain-containing protein [Clostridium indicum]